MKEIILQGTSSGRLAALPRASTALEGRVIHHAGKIARRVMRTQYKIAAGLIQDIFLSDAHRFVQHLCINPHTWIMASGDIHDQNLVFVLVVATDRAEMATTLAALAEMRP